MPDNPDPLLYTLFVAKAGDLMNQASHNDTDKDDEVWDKLRAIKAEIFGKRNYRDASYNFATKCLRVYHEQRGSPRSTDEE